MCISTLYEFELYIELAKAIGIQRRAVLMFRQSCVVCSAASQATSGQQDARCQT
jgi:hypothetical protein